MLMLEKMYKFRMWSDFRGIKSRKRSRIGYFVILLGATSLKLSTTDCSTRFVCRNMTEVIFVFPNNSNIIMTANQAAEIYKGSDVRVVPSKTIGEGYAAISMLDTEIGDTDAIIESLKEIIADVVTGTVSKAVRDTEMGGVSVRKDDYIGFVGDTIYVDSPDRAEAALVLAEKMNAKRYDIMLVCCGEDVSSDESDKLQKELSKAYRRTEVVMIDGGQPIYDYIIILE